MAIKVLKRKFKAAPVKKSKRGGQRRERDRDGIRVASVEKLEAKELAARCLGSAKTGPKDDV